MSRSSSTLSPESGLLKKIHTLIGSNLIVTMTDGRTAQGKFICLDRLGNIILEDAEERRDITYNPYGKEGIYRWETERFLSQAVIPGERLARVQISKGEYQRRTGSLLSIQTNN